MIINHTYINLRYLCVSCKLKWFSVICSLILLLTHIEVCMHVKEGCRVICFTYFIFLHYLFPTNFRAIFCAPFHFQLLILAKNFIFITGIRLPLLIFAYLFIAKVLTLIFAQAGHAKMKKAKFKGIR